jgi:hypothetical protein
MEAIGDTEEKDSHRRALGLLHFFLAYVSFVVGLLASLLLAWIPGTSRLSDEPFWLPEILAGLCLGFFCYRRVRSKIAFAVWIFPATFLAWSAIYWHRTMSVYDSTWDTYFGSQCGGSECLYELFLTAPFYSSLAYSVGATFGLNRQSFLSGPS